MNVLVIDIGTSSMRGILFEENGNEKTKVQIEYAPKYKENGIVEQKAEDFKRALCNIISEIKNRVDSLGKCIDMIALTSQRSSVTAVDKNGVALIPFIMWQDTRNKQICKRLRQANHEVFKRSGTYVNTVFSGSKMTWILENHKNIEKEIYKFVNIPEYLFYQMTGNFCTDHTYGSRSNLMNIKERKWDKELLRLFGIKEDQLCTLVQPGEKIGEITNEFSKITGIMQGIPVISAGGDQQCAALGMGIYEEGRASIVSGTGAFLMTVADKIPEKLKGDVICNASAVQDKYTLEASVLTCCSAFDWFRRNFYANDCGFDQIREILKKEYKKKSSCVVLPYFQGRATPDWNETIRASFCNLTLSTTRDEMLSALLSGIFMEIRSNINCMEQYVPIKEGFISGGLTQTGIINQMQADVYGIPLYHMKNCETTAKGALISAMVGQKICKTVNEAFKRINGNNDMETFIPNKEKHLFYKKQMQILHEEEEKWKKKNAI